MTTEIDLRHFAALLNARRAELTAAPVSEANSLELDQTRVGRLSRMDAIQSHAMAEELQRRGAVELARIEAALRRIDAGQYGDCAHCQTPIKAGRLEIYPAAELCIDCATRQEQQP